MRAAFFQSELEHPHGARARAIVKAHPEVRQLMVRNPSTGLIALSIVLEYARAIYSGETLQSVANYARLVRGVTADQVKKAAETYLNPQALRVAIVRGVKK